jgi:hypothetical protein
MDAGPFTIDPANSSVIKITPRQPAAKLSSR